MDAAHFVFGPFLGMLWCFQRLFVRAPSGRQRLNVLAALDAISHELVMVSNLSTVNAEVVCCLLGKLAAASTLPITVVLDNARYQRCLLVQQTACDLGIELLFLPPYSPNLNLIERPWPRPRIRQKTVSILEVLPSCGGLSRSYSGLYQPSVEQA